MFCQGPRHRRRHVFCNTALGLPARPAESYVSDPQGPTRSATRGVLHEQHAGTYVSGPRVLHERPAGSYMSDLRRQAKAGQRQVVVSALAASEYKPNLREITLTTRWCERRAAVNGGKILGYAPAN